jgi:hypothetical protein
VQSVAVPAHLETRIRGSLRPDGQRSGWNGRWLAVAASVLICVGAALAYEFGWVSTSSQEAYIASVSNQVATIMRVGLRDHLHCAVFRQYPQTPPKPEELEAKLGPRFAGLTQIVHDRVSNGCQLMLAHECRYHGRKFVHLGLTGNGRIVSVIIAEKGAGESFGIEGLIPAFSEAGIPVYRGGVQQFQIAAFESPRHLVYVISDLPQQNNTDMLLALAPGVQAFLKKLES